MISEEDKAIYKRGMMQGVAHGLDLVKRLPEFMKNRGWPPDQDLTSVLIGAICCFVLGARGQRFRRPKAADALGDLWPFEAGATTAKQIVDTLELDDLCKPV